MIGRWIQQVRQMRCPHVRFYETAACNAICSACDKNLGFIGQFSLEERHKREDDRGQPFERNR